jgi:RND family efflux transporter MFP subunit
MRMRKKIATGAALVLSGTLLAAGCGTERNARTGTAESVQGLHLETAKLQTVPEMLEAPGTVVSAATAEIAARTTGTVLRVEAKEGDSVKQGQMLAQIDEKELAARRNAAQAGMQQATAGVAEATRGLSMAQAQAGIAKKTYDRYTYLQQQKSVSAQEFDEVSAKNVAAGAALEQAKARLQQAEAAEAQSESEAHAAEEIAGYARIRAPFDGKVVRRLVEPGTVVMPGMQLFVLEKTGTYQLDATLPAEALAASGEAGAVKRGATAEVRLDALPGKAFSGRVAEMEAGADAATHTVNARIDLPRDAAIQSGMFGRAMFRRGEKKAIVVEPGAVVERGQLRGMFVVDRNGLAQWRVVTAGQTEGGKTEILSGLGEGERYVADPGQRELDGKRIVESTEKHS